MPALTAQKLTDLFNLYVGTEGELLWVPNDYAGPFTAAIERGLVDTPCYGLALYGGPTGDAGNELNPERLYSQLVPIDPFTDTARAAPIITLPAGMGIDDIAALTVAWTTANAQGSSDDQRRDFMRRMMTNVALLHGFTVSPAPTNYRLAMTVPRAEWYAWQHWAIGIGTAPNNFRYLQTDTTVGLGVSWGCTRVWESERDGHLLAEIYLTGIKQEHIDIIDRFLALPKCSRCRRVKPRVTPPQGSWGLCSASAAHKLCNQCRPRNMPVTRGHPYPRSGTCPIANCRSAVVAVGDNARPR